MKSKSNSVMNIINSTLEGKEPHHIPSWLIEGIDIQSIKTIKVRGKDEFDIIVSINSLESNLTGIRDIVEYACDKEGISYRKIYIEI